MPVFGVFSSQGNWGSTFDIHVWRFHFATTDLLRVIINFAIVAGVVFLITKAFVKEAAKAPTKQCKMCMEAIHPDAKRCKFCTSEV
jgi:large-conductance mechanosensitive channel